MKKNLAILALLAVAGSALLASIPALEAHAEEKNVDVYILAGQSNAVGNSKLDQQVIGQQDSAYTYRKYLAEEDARNTSGYEEVLYYGAIEVRADADFPNISLTNVHLGQGLTVNHVGPELGMANFLSQNYTKDAPAAIIKSAVGGTYLGDWEGKANNTKNFGGWASPSLLAEWKEDGRTVHQYAGRLYERLITSVTKGLEALQAQGYAPHVKGYLWMQGESDTERRDWAEEYAHNLELLITDLCADVEKITGDGEVQNRPFVIGKIAYDFADRGQPFIDNVRAAEDEVASKLPRVFTVETDGTDGLPALHIGATNGSDLWHFNAGDIYELGKRFANVAYSNLAKYLYSVKVGKGGSVQEAKALSDGEPVSITFTAERGKLLDKVLLNGKDITATAVQGNKITLTPAADSPANNEVELIFKEAQKYKLKIDLGVGGKIASRNISGSTFYADETLIFTVEPDEGYELEKVLANGEEVSAEEGNKFTVPLGQTDCTITVTFKTAGAPAPEPSKGGCGGVITGGAAFGAVLALAGIALCLKRR